MTAISGYRDRAWCAERGKYIPDPLYLRRLIRCLGWTQYETARYLRIDPRTMEKKLAGTRPVRYCEQKMLELALKEKQDAQ